MPRRINWLPLALLALAGTASADVGVGYQFAVTTSYIYLDPANPHYCGNDGTFEACGPTGILTVEDIGRSSFGGTLTMSGFSPGTGPFTDSWQGGFGENSFGLHYFILTGDAGAQGGFGPNGVQLTISGVVGFGSLSEPVNLTVFDSQIHSGVPQISPCDGLTTDAFVLQGGSPSGCENPLPFELGQSYGSFEFDEFGPGFTAPEPGYPLLLIAAVAILLAVRKKGHPALRLN